MNIFENRDDAMAATVCERQNLMSLLMSELVLEFNMARPAWRDRSRFGDLLCPVRLVFPGVNLAGLCLAGVNLSGADLRRVDFRSADLRGATLRCSNIIGARFEGALTRGADFSRMIGLVENWWLKERLAAVDCGEAERV